jgi:hypothetical protein
MRAKADLLVQWGGVVPNLAQEAHAKVIDRVCTCNSNSDHNIFWCVLRLEAFKLAFCERKIGRERWCWCFNCWFGRCWYHQCKFLVFIFMFWLCTIPRWAGSSRSSAKCGCPRARPCSCCGYHWPGIEHVPSRWLKHAHMLCFSCLFVRSDCCFWMAGQCIVCFAFVGYVCHL